MSRMDYGAETREDMEEARLAVRKHLRRVEARIAAFEDSDDPIDKAGNAAVLVREAKLLLRRARELEGLSLQYGAPQDPF